jgi:hypothetical protein
MWNSHESGRKGLERPSDVGAPRGDMAGLQQSMKFAHTRDMANVLQACMITGDVETRVDLGILSLT